MLPEEGFFGLADLSRKTGRGQSWSKQLGDRFGIAHAKYSVKLGPAEV